MLPLLGGLLSGGASLIGSIFSSNTSAANTQAQNEQNWYNLLESERFNSEQAGINRQFQAQQVGQQQQFQSDQLNAQRAYETQMSNTAYQRSRADMVAAGLNPILAAGAGGASTPPTGAGMGSAASGSSASVGVQSAATPQTRSALAGLGDAVDKAVNTAISVKTYDKMTEEIANLQAQQARTAAETSKTAQETKTEQEETVRRYFQRKIAEADLPGHAIGAASAKALGDMPAWLFNAAVQGGFLGNKASDVLAPIVSSAGAVRGFLPKVTTHEGSRSRASDGSFDEFWQSRTGFSK